MQLSPGGKIGLTIGLLGGLAGIIAAIVSDPVEGSIVAGIVVIVFVLVFIKFIRPLFVAGKLQKTGISATAVILEVSDTGTTINGNPQVKLKLEVQPAHRFPYQAETKVLISRLQTSYFQPGSIIPVKIDPNNPKNIALDTTSGNTGNLTEARKAQLEKMLMETDKTNRKIAETGRSSRAIVLKYEELGANVNGNNPAVKLLLEVLAEDRARFKAEAIGVLKEASVPKFQPGEEIEVKYDTADISKVAIISSN
jgi:hypothetical protein